MKMGFALRLAKKEIFGNRRYLRSLFLLLALVAFLLQMSVVMAGSLEKSLSEQRFDSYGAFRYAYIQQTGSPAFPAALAQRVGTIRLLGESEGAKLGSFDKTAAALGRLTLIAGVLPSVRGELAAEAGFLLARGYSCEVGQKITLPFQPYSGDGEAPAKSLSFTLCGVLENYSGIWGFGPTAVVSDREGLLGATAVQSIALIDGTPGAKAMEAVGFSEKLKENLGAYPEADIQNMSTVLLCVVAILAIACAGLLLTAIPLLVLKQRDTWRILRGLGCEKSGLQRIVLCQGLLLAGAALPAGMVLGLLCGWGTALAVGLSAELQPAHSIFAFTLALVSAGVGIIAAALLVRRTPVLHTAPKRRQPRAANQMRQIKRLNAFGLCKNRIRGQKGTAAGVVGILFGCGITTALLLHLFAYYTGEISDLQRLTAQCDLLVDNTKGLYSSYLQYLTGDEKNFPITGQTLAEIRQIYGVEALSAYRISTLENTANQYNANRAAHGFGGTQGMFTLDLSDYDDSDYYRATEGALQNRAAQALAYQREHMGWSEMGDMVGWEFGPFISYSLPEEEYDSAPGLIWSDFMIDSASFPVTVMAPQVGEGVFNSQKGMCTVVLPDLYLRQSKRIPENKLPLIPQAESAGFEKYATGWDKELVPLLFAEGARSGAMLQGYRPLSERALQVGDVLRVRFGKDTREIQVGNILRTLPVEMAYYPLDHLQPYTLLVGEDFFEGYPQYSQSERYDLVTVRVSEQGSLNAVDGQLGRISAELKSHEYVYSNLARERGRVLGEAAMSLGIFTLFTVFFLAAALVVLGRLFHVILGRSEKRIAVLRAVGLDRKALLKSYGLESLFYCFAGNAAAVFTMLGVWGAEQVRIYGGGSPVQSLVFSDGCLRFPWLGFVAFALVTAGLVVFLYYRPVKRLVGRSVTEQLRLL